jgi:hypothetical protein
MTDKERMDYYNSRGREVQMKLERMKAGKYWGFQAFYWQHYFVF